MFDFRSLKDGGKRTIFMTNTVVLARQQAEVIHKATALKTAFYTGDLKVDAWKKDKWYKEFDDNQVRFPMGLDSRLWKSSRF